MRAEEFRGAPEHAYCVPIDLPINGLIIFPATQPRKAAFTGGLLDTGRRRRFSVDAKRRIVEESFVSGDGVSAVARRHGLLPAQLFAWRRAAREGEFGIWRGTGDAGGFVEAQVVPELRHTDRHRAVGRGNGQMEVVSANGRRVVVDRDADVDALLRIIRALETLR